MKNGRSCRKEGSHSMFLRWCFFGRHRAVRCRAALPRKFVFVRKKVFFGRETSFGENLLELSESSIAFRVEAPFLRVAQK